MKTDRIFYDSFLNLIGYKIIDFLGGEDTNSRFILCNVHVMYTVYLPTLQAGPMYTDIK